jgi:predicted esterase
MSAAKQLSRAFGAVALRAVRASVCLAAALAAPAALAQQASLDAKWRALFARMPADTKRMSEVLAACGNSPDALKGLFASDSAYPQLRPGWHRRTLAVVCGEARHDVEFLFRVPSGYSPERSYPLLLAAHGQGGNGRTIGAMVRRRLGAEAEKHLILAPTMPGPRRYTGSSLQEQAYLKPLEWCRLNLNVDDDRVCVVGYSMGGHGAWHLATMFPRLFAAALPMAGVPIFEGSPYTSNAYLENLAHLPVWAVWGELDRKGPGTMSNVHFSRMAARRLKELGSRKFEGTELPGVGHAGCWPGRDDFVSHLASHMRLTVPESFVHVLHSRRHGRGYYVEAVRFSRPEVDFSAPVKPKVRFKPGEDVAEAVIRAGQELYGKHLFRIQADLDRAGNALSIRASGVSAVRVYVMAGMFDLARPVTLRYGARTWAVRIEPSARCMLAHYAAARDSSAVVYNEVELDSGGKLTVRFEPPTPKAGG